MCWVSVAHENRPVKLVPKIGDGIMAFMLGMMHPMYHTIKNGVKASEPFAEGVQRGRYHDLPETDL